MNQEYHIAVCKLVRSLEFQIGKQFRFQHIYFKEIFPTKCVKSAGGAGAFKTNFKES